METQPNTRVSSANWIDPISFWVFCPRNILFFQRISQFLVFLFVSLEDPGIDCSIVSHEHSLAPCHYRPVFAVQWETGPTFAVAVIACILGLVQAVIILCLRYTATHERDGPFTRHMPSTGGGTSMERAKPPSFDMETV